MQHQHYGLRSIIALSLLTSPTLGTFFNDALKAHIDQGVWDAALSTPNATGTYSMVGFNISGPFSDTEISGWTISIRVSTNRETHNPEPEDSDDDDDDDDDENYFTGTSISVRAPDALLRDNQVILSQDLQNETTWKVRAYVIDGLKDDVTEKAQSDDGSCTSFLSQQCIAEWQDYYVKTNGSLSQEPGSCQQDLGRSWGVWATEDFIPLTAFNNTELFARAQTGEELDDDGDWYEKAVTDIWPVMMVYYSVDADNVTRNEQARLTCVRAKNITEGSVQPNAATTLFSAPASWMTMMGTVGAAAVFLVL
ncbi:hypothetical protein F4677DRAFT_174499 [Hypoxylon crocopeplum]|nr:hypothetical protein F4677DRAFT_174499 [Hypoxylon crocopeplum]